jgi:hypothetical protein
MNLLAWYRWYRASFNPLKAFKRAVERKMGRV